MDDINPIIELSKDLHILYVEDNQVSREMTVFIFEEFFNKITIAVDGEDGYKKFQENKIDLIITDINMPKLTGIEMIDKIRAVNNDIPILVLSAYNESDFFMDSIKLGVDGYLLKPIDMKQFMSVLEKVSKKIKISQDLKSAISLLHQYQQATDYSCIVSKTDTTGLITYVNDAFCRVSEFSREELIGKNHDITRHPDMPQNVFEELWNTIRNKKQIWKGVIRNLSKSGKSYYVDSTMKPILDEHGNIKEYISLRNDITDIMHPKKQLDDAIKSTQSPLIVYMRIEDYYTLEELYDNSTIEQLQDKLTPYLEDKIPSVCDFDKVYQLGNGEYAMTNDMSLCMKDENIFIEQIKQYQELVREKNVSIGEVDFDISMMISLAYNDSQVLESAKLGIRALLKNKQDFIVANNLAQREQDKAKQNIKTISMVKKAINDFRIISHFQPIINNKTHQIEKYESLVRLIDEKGKTLSPLFFLDTAKKGKYYSQITDIVLDNSFRALKSTDMNISINLSAIDIELQSTREKIFKLLKQNKDFAARIIVELLEDECVKNFGTIQQFISEIKDLGVKIAIDDFGAGYSNFERLLDYQPDILKIDACLIRDIETNNYSLSVVKTIVAFAKEQNILTVAEYVENEAIFTILNDLGVDYSQGYYFGKPEALPVMETRHD